MRYILQLIIAVFYIVIGILFNDHFSPHFISEGIFIIVSITLVDLLYDLYKNRDRINLKYQCWLLSRKNEFIRFSMSYQYRIKIKDKYLLVKNSKENFYQHVGGKYKRLPVTVKILRDWNATDDTKMQTHGLTKDDLAVFIPAENAIKFIDWFNTRRDREISHWREFYEELIDGKGKVLLQNTFPYVNYNYIKSVRTPLKRAEAPGWNCWEILQYDVLDLLPTPEQEKELELLQEKGDDEYFKWADNGLIQKLGNQQGKVKYQIAKHTKWVLNLKWNKE
jgi:hypothetical protein